MLTNYTIDGFENIKYQGFGKLKFIENKLSELFKRFGYCQVETPTFENYEFYANEDAVNKDDLFKLINASGKILALKPDVTLPVARMAAINHHDPEEIIKFSYLTNIYKDFSNRDKSRKETTQTGIEYFGNSDPACDAEVVALAIIALSSFGIENIHIDLGHVGFINALLDEIQVNKSDREKLFNLIENKNIGDIKEFLKDKNNIPEKYKEILIEIPRLFGEPKDVFKRMNELAVTPKMKAAVDRLTMIYDHLKELGMHQYITFDIGFTNRMNYYTGMIFKGYIDELGEAVLNGGRYDSLSSRFGIDRPACGFSLDLISFMDHLNSKNLLPEEGEPKYILLYPLSERAKAFDKCNDIRKTGRSAEMFYYKDDPKETIKKIMKNSHYEGSEIVQLEGNEYYLWDPITYEREKIK